MSQSEGNTTSHRRLYRSQVAGEGGGFPHYDWVRRCGVDTAFHLAYLRFPPVEGRAPDGPLPGSYQLYERSNVQYAWLDEEERDAQHAPPGHVAGGEPDEGMCSLG